VSRVAGANENIVLTFHRSIAVWAASGVNLVVDGSLPYGSPALRAECLQVFSSFDLRVIGVRCSNPVLARRERDRPDRIQGWAERQAKDIHDGVHLDAMVDTSTESALQCAQTVLNQLGIYA
jgi:chloramphenicol 3-O phosphotransferase